MFNLYLGMFQCLKLKLVLISDFIAFQSMNIEADIMFERLWALSLGQVRISFSIESYLKLVGMT